MKRMVSNHTIQDFENRIEALEQGGGGSTIKTYGIKLKELWEKLGRPGDRADLRNITKEDLLNNGLPILDTNVAKQSSYPYRNLVIDVATGESNEIILEGIFGVARGDDVELFSTGSSWYGNEPALYAWRNGGEDWMFKNTRWADDRTVGNYVPVYVVFDFTDVNTFFEYLNENVGLYYYDSDSQQYISVGSGTYDPDVTYYLEAAGNYYPQPITPEAYFNYAKTHIGFGYIYIKNGDSYEIIDYETEYDATQTYYKVEHESDPIHMVSPTNEGTLGVSSKATNQLINVFEANIMIKNPIVNTRYGTQMTAPTTDGNYVLGCSVSASNPTFSWSTPTIPTDIAVNSANIANNIEIYSNNNAYAIYCSNNALPFEIGSVTGAWFRIGTDGAISLTSVDPNTSTAHLYEFKADGLYLDGTKITS